MIGEGDSHETEGIGPLDAGEMKRLMRVSLGKEKADLVIRGGDVINVYSAERLHKHAVAVKGRRVAYVGPDVDHTIGPETKVIDASGKVLIPGLVDGHTHIFFYVTPHEFLKSVMKSGVTTIVTEIMEFTFSLGYRGLVEYLDAMRNQPVKVFATVPPSISFNEESQKRAPSLEELISMLEREEVLGVGESFWQEVIRGETNLPDLAAALAPSRLIISDPLDGNGGASDIEGISNDMEIIQAAYRDAGSEDNIIIIQQSGKEFLLDSLINWLIMNK